MAVFIEPWQTNPLDWLILQIGYVQKYHNENILNNDVEWFANEKYKIIEFDCREWTTSLVFQDDLMKKLNFPDYYGKNWAALDDCFSDLDFVDAGILLIFRHIDSWNKEEGQTLLDIFSKNSRYHLLFGNRLIALIQIDNPEFDYLATGACPIWWNSTEWSSINQSK